MNCTPTVSTDPVNFVPARWSFLPTVLGLCFTSACEQKGPAPAEEIVPEKTPAKTETTLQEQSPVQLGGTFIIPGRHTGALQFDLGMKDSWDDVSLKINSPKPGQLVDGDEVDFTVDLQGYETEPGGAHVHVKVDNLPYQAYYKAGKEPFKLNLKELGLQPGMHRIRAFPSRPWHESVKAPHAFAPTYFYYKEKTADVPKLDGPLLTYSRPKGRYEVTPPENRILFDYYLSGAQMGPNAYSIRYTLDDRLPITVVNWAPIWLEALEPGKHTIKVELLDENEAVANTPFNPTEETFEVAIKREDGA